MVDLPAQAGAMRAQLEHQLQNRGIETSPAYKALGPEDQAKLEQIQSRATAMGKTALRQIADKGLLTSRDTPPEGQEPRRLLDNLHDMATDGGPAKDGAREVLSHTMFEIANPGNIEQGDRGTCAVASAQYDLVRTQPAEYARLVKGLSSDKGEVQLHNGALVRREPGSETDDGSGRTSSGRLFQAAMMEYGNGARDYSNETDLSTARDGASEPVPGLNGFEAARVRNGLFAESFELEPKRDYSNDDRFAAGSQAIVPAPGGSHALSIEGTRDGRVYLRDPNGPSAFPAGSDGVEGDFRDLTTGEVFFKLRIENASEARFSMSLEDFNRAALGVVKSSDLR